MWGSGSGARPGTCLQGPSGTRPRERRPQSRGPHTGDWRPERPRLQTPGPAFQAPPQANAPPLLRPRPRPQAPASARSAQETAWLG